MNSFHRHAYRAIRDRLLIGMRAIDGLAFELSIQCANDPSDPPCRFDSELVDKAAELREMFARKLDKINRLLDEAPEVKS